VAAKQKPLTTRNAEFVQAAEQRIAAHLEEIERAKSEGRLAELIRNTPSIREQLAGPTEASA
jgi:hypothetical protein